jgi:THO complex subunit 4
MDLGNGQAMRMTADTRDCNHQLRLTNISHRQEYFVQSVGPIKRVELSYGPNSQSRGIANVSFRDSEGASRAYQKLNGLLVDGRPIKV